MKKIILFAIGILSATVTASAQFVFQGKIEYERKMNVHRAIDNLEEDEKSWAEKSKPHMGKYHIMYYNLYFTQDKTLYKPGNEPSDNPRIWAATPPNMQSTILTHVKMGKVTANKEVYEEKFLLADSMRKLKWKIHDEIRTIANYKCRKAVSVICDSVYVVAFYTEDIPVSGGPELFSGLPGMILELAIPRLYTTWIATKVEMDAPSEADLALKEKGKTTDMKHLHEKVSESLKRWGNSAQRYVWWAML